MWLAIGYRTYPSVHNFLEMHSHSATTYILVFVTFMDEHTDFLWPNFIGSEAKYKEHRIDDIGFPTTIRTDNRRKTL